MAGVRGSFEEEKLSVVNAVVRGAMGLLP